jgi:methylated-DNA-[protein]-cysteine S-methyltransferase
MTNSKAYFQSPFGTVLVRASKLGIQSVQWLDETKERSVPEELEECVLQLEEYFARERTAFELKLDWSEGGVFDKKVWEYLLSDVTYGKTVSYSEIAIALGDVKKVRAVGGANARNPIPIIVPCHRVIGKNGSLTGFAYGLDMKAKLLGLERPLDFAEQASLF